MWRTTVTRPDLSGEALDELKQWLGITRSDEDSQLLNLLEAAFELCEAYTRQTPLTTIFDEAIPAKAGDYELQSRPVRALTSFTQIFEAAAPAVLPTDWYTTSTQPDGVTNVQLLRDIDARAIVVRVQSGIASNWSFVARPLKQGIIRLAAHYYQDRDRGRTYEPPASVAALWQPWRAVRLL